MQLTTYIFYIACAVLSGIIIGAIFRRDMLFAWRESARRWKVNTEKLLKYNHNLAQELFVAEQRATGLENDLMAWGAEIEMWKDYYNQAHANEIELREQVWVLGGDPDAKV